jgi:hypothetical protein
MNDPSAETAVSYLPQWLHDVGSVASVLSIIVTVPVLFQVARLAKHYRVLVLAPNLHSQLATHLRNLERFLVAKNWSGFCKESALVVGAASATAPLCERQLRLRMERVVTTGRSVVDQGGDTLLQSQAAALVYLVAEVSSHLKNHIEDRRWKIKI